MSFEAKKLQIIDPETHEVFNGGVVLTRRKQRSEFSKDGFLLVSQKFAEKLANEELKGLDGVTLKILWKILAKLEMNNVINIKKSEIAAKMGLKPSNFSRSFKRLCENKIILEESEDGKNKIYRLNSVYVWKGTTEKHNEQLKKDKEKLKKDEEELKTKENQVKSSNNDC